MECSLSGSSVHGISQAIILEWVAIFSSRGSSRPGTEPVSPALTGRVFTTEPPGKPHVLTRGCRDASRNPGAKTWFLHETQARTRNPNTVDCEPHSPREPHWHPALAASLRYGQVHVLESSHLEGVPPPSAPPSPICDSDSQGRG